MLSKFFSFLAFLSVLINPLFADLIPRNTLFQTSSCLALKISPDGKCLAYVGAEKEGSISLFVTLGLSLDKKERLAEFKEGEIQSFYWFADSAKLLLVKSMPSTCSLVVIDLKKLSFQNWTKDFSEIDIKVLELSHKENMAVIAIKDKKRLFYDLYLLDLATNTLSRFYRNEETIDFLFDQDLKLRCQVKLKKDGSLTIQDKYNHLLYEVEAEDALHFKCLKFSKSENALYLLDSKGSNTTSLKKVFLDKGREEILGNDPKSDIKNVYFAGSVLLAYTSYYTEQNWHCIEEKNQAHFTFLISKLGPNFNLVDSSADQMIWILRTEEPSRGVQFWLYQKKDNSLQLLHTHPEGLKLASMYPHVITTTDGLRIICYLTLPKEKDIEGMPITPLPLVVIPHGGPFKVRDYFSYHPLHQWLANRGYAVLSVNYRLSSGLGKHFVQAGAGQWGRRAHEDILDAVEWCIEHGIADKNKIALLGGSYGGYAALCGLTFSPDTFACAVALCGPSNLKTILDSLPPYWERPDPHFSDKWIYFTKREFIQSIGKDPSYPSSLPYFKRSSPLFHTQNIRKPLLLVHGLKDPIVAAAESNQLFERMKENHLPVIYLVFPEEGHSLSRYSSEMCYLAYSEWLFAKILGGKFEPSTEEELASANVEINSSCLDTTEVKGALKP